MKIVTYDGDGNGATTLQTKIQLWNRTGKGWPDVIFSEQVNDPVWMAKKPFEFAAAVKGLIPDRTCSASGRRRRPRSARSTARSTACRTTSPRSCCGSTRSRWTSSATPFRRRGRSGRHSGRRSPRSIPATSSATSGTPSATGSTCGATSARSQQFKGDKLLINSTDEHCTRMASLLDPLIKNGTLPPLSVFTPDFAKKYGGGDDKVLLMPGPAWYATSLFDDTLHIPAGRDHGRDRRCSGRTSRRSRPARSAADRGSSPSTPRTSRLRRTSSPGRRPCSTRPAGRTARATRLTRPWPTAGSAAPGQEPLLRRRPDAGAEGGRAARSGRAGTWSRTRTSPSGPTPS